jgi:hypothetical protein
MYTVSIEIVYLVRKTESRDCIEVLDLQFNNLSSSDCARMCHGDTQFDTYVMIIIRITPYYPTSMTLTLLPVYIF